MAALSLGALKFGSVLRIYCVYDKYKLTGAIGGKNRGGTRRGKGEKGWCIVQLGVDGPSYKRHKETPYPSMAAHTIPQMATPYSTSSSRTAMSWSKLNPLTTCFVFIYISSLSILSFVSSISLFNSTSVSLILNLLFHLLPTGTSAHSLRGGRFPPRGATGAACVAPRRCYRPDRHLFTRGGRRRP